MDSWAAAGWLTLPWHLGGPLAPGTRVGWCRHLHANLRRSWGPRPVNSHKKEDVTLNTEEARPGETGGLRSHHVHFYWEPRVPRSFWVFFISMVRPQILWGFIHCGRWIGEWDNSPLRVIKRSFEWACSLADKRPKMQRDQANSLHLFPLACVTHHLPPVEKKTTGRD